MTVENPIPGFDIEKFIRDLSWSEDTDDYSKTLVAGNLRNLFASIGQHVSTTMSTAEPVSEQTPPCGFPYCDCSMGAAERCERPAALSHVQAPGDEPFGYFCECKGADPAFLRKPSWIPPADALHTTTPLYTHPTPQIDDAMVERGLEIVVQLKINMEASPVDNITTVSFHQLRHIEAALQAAIGGEKP